MKRKTYHEQAVALFRVGMTGKEISTLIGCPYNTVMHIRKRMRLRDQLDKKLKELESKTFDTI